MYWIANCNPALRVRFFVDGSFILLGISWGGRTRIAAARVTALSHWTILNQGLGWLQRFLPHFEAFVCSARCSVFPAQEPTVPVF